MSIHPSGGRLLSLDDWAALPEDESRDCELVGGVLQMNPKPMPMHQRVAARIWAMLDSQLPRELESFLDVDVVVSGGSAATVRAPDVVVVPSSVADTNPARFRAEDVLLAVEVLSPGSRRTDRVAKFAEYAEAGIESYWLIDPDQPLSLASYRLIGGEYELDAESADKIELREPAPVSLDLPALVAGRS